MLVIIGIAGRLKNIFNFVLFLLSWKSMLKIVVDLCNKISYIY